MSDAHTLECCGLLELVDISDHCGDAESVLLNHAYDVSGNVCGVLFTQASRGTYGDKLANYIRKHQLGTVTSTRLGANPNTGNHIKLFVWKVNEKALDRWINKMEDAEKL